MAARVAVDRLGQYLSAPTKRQAPLPPYNMQRMRAALPPPTSNANARGPRRRRRSAPPIPRTVGGASIVVADTEYLGMVPKDLTHYLCNPAPTALPRLDRMSKMYHRFRIISFKVAYKPGVGTATAGNVSAGICIGPAVAAITLQDHINKLNPSFFTPGWKAATFTVPPNSDPARYMVSGDTSVNGVSFTLYAMASAESLGQLVVTYRVEFSHPINF